MSIQVQIVGSQCPECALLKGPLDPPRLVRLVLDEVGVRDDAEPDRPKKAVMVAVGCDRCGWAQRLVLSPAAVIKLVLGLDGKIGL